MGLIEHAKRELKLAGFFDKDSDYNGLLGKAVLSLIKVISKQGHSGFSIRYTVALFNKLVKFENLTPIKRSDFIRVGEDVYQCKRNSSLFLMYDTYYYNINEKKLSWFARLFVKNYNGLRLYKLKE